MGGGDIKAAMRFDVNNGNTLQMLYQNGKAKLPIPAVMQNAPTKPGVRGVSHGARELIADSKR